MARGYVKQELLVGILMWERKEQIQCIPVHAFILNFYILISQVIYVSEVHLENK